MSEFLNATDVAVGITTFFTVLGLAALLRKNFSPEYDSAEPKKIDCLSLIIATGAAMALPLILNI